ncbi:glycosyltransferase, partial [Campylobacter volucris]|uniref:glycosyltransferase n=1 Tax=Campylobacter volucris TaxID=1031542 RepID=UPI00189D0FE3
ILKYENKNSIVLLNDGFFIPLFKHAKLLYCRIWHLVAPKRKKMIFNKIDILILLSEKELHTWGFWHKNIKIIPNFLPIIPNKISKVDNNIVLSVGRLTQEKGFLRLIEIWKIIQKNNTYNNWKLIIVGSGELKNALKEKIDKNKLNNTIILKPFTKNIYKEYLNASIYAMCSHEEGFGMALAESASYGLPGVAFDINTGPSDIIENKKSGFLIKDGDLQDFANKLCLLMDNKNMRKTMGL